MKSVMSEHQFEKLAEYSDGAAYRVLVKINMNLGWIENVKCCIENLRQKQMFQMKYKCQEDDFACFELYINLPTQAVFYYYFSFEANGQFYYYKKTNETGNQCVSKEECWKLSVNFEVPDWAQGAIMYHIFVDRYRRGSKAQLSEMPYRKIHKSWNEQPVIGPDEDGLCGVRAGAEPATGRIRGLAEPAAERLGDGAGHHRRPLRHAQLRRRDADVATDERHNRADRGGAAAAADGVLESGQRCAADGAAVAGASVREL